LSGQAHAILGLQPGVRGGFYEDSDSFFLGVDLKSQIAILHANPNFEWVFVDDGDLFTLNLDAFVNVFPLPVVDPWLGAGVGIGYSKPDTGDSESDFLFNLIAGVGFNILLDPYVMIKYIIAEDNTFVLAGGIRF
jgi:hypothetical protein